MVLKVKKICEDARLPAYGSENAAGADIRSLEEITIAPGESAAVKTGLCMEIPEGYAGLVCARSGLALKRGLAPANKVGVIDSDYRGEVLVALYNQSGLPQKIEAGERIAQLLIVPCVQAEFEEADALSDTARADGGFGSTGRK